MILGILLLSEELLLEVALKAEDAVIHKEDKKWSLHLRPDNGVIDTRNWRC